MYLDEYKKWAQSPYISDDERTELLSIANDESEIKERFFAPLSFGTAGLRGILGMGTNRMNPYTVRQTTEAIARLIERGGEPARQKGCAISFDCRHYSAEFSREAACIMAAHGIRVYLFSEMRPTPELSFAVRHYGCMAGINITASHNPKEYNGYKVYWEGGAQLPPEESAVVSAEMQQIDLFTGIRTLPFGQAVASGLIRMIGKETDERFLAEILKLQVDRTAVPSVADHFKLVYTPFHGTGYQLIPEILHRIGYKHVLCVPEQMVPDGDFPTVKSPNPEDKAGFALAIELARENDVDLIIGSDPDADRIGIILRAGDGDYVPLSGNQVGVLLLEYIITAGKEQGTLPANPAVIKTIVTTEMTRVIAERAGAACFDVFTGFKFIAEKIKELEDAGTHRYILAFEESYGYLAGDHTRDKDAVAASMLVGEMAAYYHRKGMTLYDAMESLYAKYGCYGEHTINLVMPGTGGLADMAALMLRLRKAPPAELAGTPVAFFRDYLAGTVFELVTGKKENLEISGSDVLYFHLEDDTRFIVRPSGTEPKIKLYLLTCGKDHDEVSAKLECFTKAAKSLAE